MRFLLIGLIIISCSNKSDEKLWIKAEECKKRNNYDSTIYFCKEIIKKYPDGNYIAPAIYLIADLSYNKTKNYKEASHYFNLFIEKYPNEELTPYAMYISGFIYIYNLNKIDSGKLKYEKFLKLFPNHKLTSIVKNEIAFLNNHK